MSIMSGMFPSHFERPIIHRATLFSAEGALLFVQMVREFVLCSLRPDTLTFL